MATMFKFRGVLDDLIHQLQSQRVFFYIDILQLLREARVADMISEVDQTEEVCILRDARTRCEIHEYLGHLYLPFLQILERYEMCLKRIAASLGHLIRPENAAKDDLAAIIQANSDPNMTLSVKGLELTIKHKHLLAVLDDLRTERLSLKIAIKGIKEQKLFETQDPSRASLTLSHMFADVHTRATGVNTRKVRIQLPTITVSKIATQKLPLPFQRDVMDICDSARQAQSEGQILALRLAANTSFELLDGGAKAQRIITTAITLADFLQDTVQDEDARMTPKQQALLALDVASSVLQLQQTLWCSIPWNSAAIKFFVQKERDCSSVVCTPYVEQTPHASVAQPRRKLSVKKTLLELAIFVTRDLASYSARNMGAKERLGGRFISRGAGDCGNKVAGYNIRKAAATSPGGHRAVHGFLQWKAPLVGRY
ncbi:hypothetical protein B0T25DRAFT_581856 [Lasiosphaeria hispida]|uniref:DUF7580 domain-containing protein n=1 Tax=Lasiosphaeria hispida TaxID=260671 RepID=A0AAJ0HE04_9PEZI|nr:hypothetical protein B0T25DRAFT_581856 [Lasiosphaeria hispida]